MICRQSVVDNFIPFSVKFEGKVTWPYLDVKSLVTIGIGNLIDSVAVALELPFVLLDRSPATRDDIALGWHAVKDRGDLAHLGHRAFEHITNLRLTDEGVRNVVLHKLETFDAFMPHRFPKYAAWCADAQLLVLSMSWAAGPAFVAPNFVHACNDGNWIIAAIECHLDEHGNPGLKPRNEANAMLAMNAAHVAEGGLDPEALYWPATVMAPVEIVADPL